MAVLPRGPHMVASSPVSCIKTLAADLQREIMHETTTCHAEECGQESPWTMPTAAAINHPVPLQRLTLARTSQGRAGLASRHVKLPNCQTLIMNLPVSRLAGRCRIDSRIAGGRSGYHFMGSFILEVTQTRFLFRGFQRPWPIARGLPSSVTTCCSRRLDRRIRVL